MPWSGGHPGQPLPPADPLPPVKGTDVPSPAGVRTPKQGQHRALGTAWLTVVTGNKLPLVSLWVRLTHSQSWWQTLLAGTKNVSGVTEGTTGHHSLQVSHTVVTWGFCDSWGPCPWTYGHLFLPAC
jgi:hypothetical protein